MKSLVQFLILLQSVVGPVVLVANDDLQGSAGDFLPIPVDITPSQREVVMPELGNSKLEKLLTRYYTEGLGGASVWEGVNSLRIQGTILFGDETYELLIFQRKPNLSKMIFTNGKRVMVVGYDGEEAWDYFPNLTTEGSVLSGSKAREFIHSAIFGNYLLFPYRSNKTLQYLGTKSEDNTICHVIRVLLDSQFQVDYYIDVRDFLESKIINNDLKNSSTTTLMSSDFRVIDGVKIAHKIKSFNEDGAPISNMSISKVDLNLGLTPWFFKRPVQ